ncbi:MAG: alpha/beta hydrolase [Humibacillus sp.]|nr:alpha/beta hydrolase [Humibacillus sp.]MDN5776066.1 alpha/beta hydrolase [Humibacillus sp.]
MQQLLYARTPVLDIAYYDEGRPDGEPVVLLHGYPYDVNSYVDVVPLLVRDGFRVIVPFLRGHGPTRFLDPDTSRSGEQAALGKDVIDLLDALNLPRATLAGYDWGARAACVVAALWPQRCTALVSVNGYLIQNIAASATPLRADLEAGFWYFFYFLTPRGAAGLRANRRAIARVIWARNSPAWTFSDTVFDRVAGSFDNPDYVDVVLHSYRHRLGYAEGDPTYADIEHALADQPTIPVPAVTLDGEADGNFPATDGSAAAARFTGPRTHHTVPVAGHNLPAEAPAAFAAAVLEAIGLTAEVLGAAP